MVHLKHRFHKGLEFLANNNSASKNVYKHKMNWTNLHVLDIIPTTRDYEIP